MMVLGSNELMERNVFITFYEKPNYGKAWERIKHELWANIKNKLPLETSELLIFFFFFCVL